MKNKVLGLSSRITIQKTTELNSTVVKTLSPTKIDPIEELSEHYKERILNHFAVTQNIFLN
jgi:hypothetical protein